MDRRYLELVAVNFGGGPVGIETIAAALSEPRDAIEDIIEPYLLQQGFLQRTPRGRLLTPQAFRHLGLAEPASPAAQFGLFGGRRRSVCWPRPFCCQLLIELSADCMTTTSRMRRATTASGRLRCPVARAGRRSATVSGMKSAIERAIEALEALPEDTARARRRAHRRAGRKARVSAPTGPGGTGRRRRRARRADWIPRRLRRRARQNPSG